MHPFASLTEIVPEECPRILINMDKAGDIGSRPDDVLLLGKSDEIIMKLCEALGQDWVDELNDMWKETEKYARKEEEEEPKSVEAFTRDEKVLAESETLRDEVDKLTKEVEKALRIGKVPTDDNDAGAHEDAKGGKDSSPPEEPVSNAEDGKKQQAKIAQEEEKDNPRQAEKKAEEQTQQPDKPDGKL